MYRYIHPYRGQVRQVSANVWALIEHRNIRNKGVYQEDPGLIQMRRDVLEAPNLLVLVGEHEEGVGDDEDEREGALYLDVREVPNGDRKRSPAFLRSKLVYHCLGSVYPVYLNAASR